MKSAASQRRKASRSIYKFFTKLNGLHLQSDAASFLEKHFEDQPNIDEALSHLAKAYKKQFTGTFWSIGINTEDILYVVTLSRTLILFT